MTCKPLGAPNRDFVSLAGTNMPQSQTGPLGLPAVTLDALQGLLLWVIPQPVEGHQAEVEEVDLAIAVDVAGDDCLAGRLAEV